MRGTIAALVVALGAATPVRAQPQNFRTEANGQVIPLPGRKLDPDCLARPVAQFSTWVGLGVGAAHDERRSLPSVDVRAGGGVTGPLTHRGVLRAGPFLELRAAPQLGYAMGFAELELSLGELPRRLLEQRYSRTMEGVIAVRGGVGWSPRGALATATITYGTRATGETVEGYNYYGHCRGPAEDVVDGTSVGRGIGGCDYASGIRAFASATADRQRDWQLVVGIELEPFSFGTFLNPPQPL